MSDMIPQLRKIVQDAIGSDKEIDLEPTEPLDSVITSSLQFVVVLGEIERVFSIQIPESDLEAVNFENLSSIASVIERAQLGASASA